SHPGIYTVGFPVSGSCSGDTNTTLYPVTTIGGAVKKIEDSGGDYYVRSKAIAIYRTPNSPNYCPVAQVHPQGASFEASASGLISPGADPGNAAHADQWKLNNQ